MDGDFECDGCGMDVGELYENDDGWFCSDCMSCGSEGCGYDGKMCELCIEEGEALEAIASGETVH